MNVVRAGWTKQGSPHFETQLLEDEAGQAWAYTVTISIDRSYWTSPEVKIERATTRDEAWALVVKEVVGMMRILRGEPDREAGLRSSG